MNQFIISLTEEGDVLRLSTAVIGDPDSLVAIVGGKLSPKFADDVIAESKILTSPAYKLLRDQWRDRPRPLGRGRIARNAQHYY